MDDSSGLMLGQSMNLIDGFKATPFCSTATIPSAQPALFEMPSAIDNQTSNGDAAWSWPIISLHPNVEDLLSTLMQIKLRPCSFEDKPSEGGGIPRWPIGALVLAGLPIQEREKKLSNLSKEIQLDLNCQEHSYALVRRSRFVGSAVHPCCKNGMFRLVEPTEKILRPEMLQALKKLRKLSKDIPAVNKEGAEGYMQVYNTFGSHFISSVDYGDYIFQIFAYKSAEYTSLVDIYKKNPTHLSGPTASSFALYTVKRNDAGYGYTAAASKICLASNDPAFAISLSRKLWYDDTYALHDSIFTPFLHSDSVDVNKMLKRNVAIGIELASLSLFAEYIRKHIWHRIFKGAMYAKFFNGMDVAPYFCNNCPYNFDEIYRNSDVINGDGFLSNIATPTVNIFKEYIDLSSLALQAKDIVTSFSTFNNALKIPNAVINIPGSSSVAITSHIISVEATGPRPPTMFLSKPAFAKLKNQMFCGEFYGGLLVRSSDESHDEQSLVIMNGLVFEVVSGRVTLTTDVQAFPSSDILKEHVIDFQFSLVAAEARLNFLLSIGKNSASDSISLMRRFLIWLGQAVVGDACTNDILIELKARAMYLAKLACTNNNAGIPIPFLKYETYKDAINNVQDILQTVSLNMIDFQKQIRERQQEEREIDRKKNLNENIIKSGNLLQTYIQAQATYQGTLHDQFTSIIKAEETKLQLLDQKAKEYSENLKKQRRIVQLAVEEYQTAVQKRLDEETIKAVLDIASNLFNLAFVFIAPASSITALEKLGKTVQKIQKAVKIFDAAIKTYRSFQSFPKNPRKFVSLLNEIGSGLQLPSSLEWDEMQAHMDNILSTGFDDITAKKSLSTAFQILVLRGKALLEVQNEIQAKLSKLSGIHSQMRIHDEQQKRLSQLKVKLSAEPKDLDVSSIDLISLTGQLTFFERQMLMTMASIVTIQDRALQYEYLQQPTPIESFSFISLQLAILSQSQSINRGLVVQPLPTLQPDPIVYEVHGVKPESLINNKSFTFNISLSKREFASYNYIRIANIKAEIGGIIFTESGKYYIELHFDGHPFYDRSFDGEKLTFQTISRFYTFSNNVADSFHCMDEVTLPSTPEESLFATLTSGDNPFEGKITNITPFSTWKISLPPTQSNAGIKFDNCSRGLTIRLTFQIFAQLKEMTTSCAERCETAFTLRQRAAETKPNLPASRESFASNRKATLNSAATSSQSYGLMNEATSDVSKGFSSNRETALNVVTSEDSFLMNEATDGATIDFASNRKAAATLIDKVTSDVSKADVLNMMVNKSVCFGWDAVFSLTAKQINDNLYKQYSDRVNNPKFLRSTGDVVKESKTSEGYTTKTAFNFTFKAPRLQFLLNNSNVAQVYFPLKSGHYQYSIKFGGKWIEISKADITEDKDYFVQGDIPLAVLPGEVSSQKNIALKLREGGFSTQGFTPGTSDPLINGALTSYFISLKDGYEVYNLGTLETKDFTLLPSLIPKTFLLNVYHSPSNRDILQVFIATTGEVQSDTSLHLREPIPSIYECSLIINSRIFFSKILPTTLGGCGLGLLYQSKQPTNNSNEDKAWTASVTTGKVSADYPPSMVRHDIYTSGGPDPTTSETEHYVAVKNNSVTIDLHGMTFKSGDQNSEWDAEMTFTKEMESKFKYGTRTKVWGSFFGWSKINYKPYSLKVSVKMNARLGFKVVGSGQNQLLQLIVVPSTNPLIDGRLEPPGVCKCNDRELQLSFLENLRNGMEPKLQPIFDKQFKSISMFALKNILFPAKNLIELKEIYVPGDLVIFGNFTQQTYER